MNSFEKTAWQGLVRRLGAGREFMALLWLLLTQGDYFTPVMVQVNIKA
jgi:hypothetical protein